MIHIAFELTMPNRGSWNGKWSGEDERHIKIVSFKNKDESVQRCIEAKSFYHRWEDGWGASVRMTQVTSIEAKKLMKASKGFLGYDWMIANFLDHGTPYDKAA